MNLHCKCGNYITDEDLSIDPNAEWCRECYGTSQNIINDWEEIEDINEDFGDNNE